jgi:hypothetical protein
MAQTEVVARGLSDYLDALGKLDDLRNLGSFLQVWNRVQLEFDNDDVAVAFDPFQDALESLAVQIDAVSWRIGPIGRVVPQMRPASLSWEIYDARRYYSTLRTIEAVRQMVVERLRELLSRQRAKDAMLERYRGCV